MKVSNSQMITSKYFPPFPFFFSTSLLSISILRPQFPDIRPLTLQSSHQKNFKIILSPVLNWSPWGS
jgi:hypothetical protein